MINFGPFKEFHREPTTLKYGHYFVGHFSLPFAKDKRAIRVWLPEDYDFNDSNKRFPVLYFSDGQNLVDRDLSAYGEWELDKTAHKILKETGKTFIAVGIDCPKSPLRRFLELNPPYPIMEGKEVDCKKYPPYGDKYIDYIKDELKPLIDSLFFTIPDKEHTGVGGSSMGGIFAYFAYMYAPETFGFALSFSPAFFNYHRTDWLKILDKYELDPKKNGKVFFYVGGREFEELFYESTIMTYQYMRKLGFDHDQIRILFDSYELHHESAWAKYLEPALKFFLED